MHQIGQTGKKELPILVKGDVQGSVEAINGALDNLGNDEVPHVLFIPVLAVSRNLMSHSQRLRARLSSALMSVPMPRPGRLPSRKGLRSGIMR